MLSLQFIILWCKCCISTIQWREKHCWRCECWWFTQGSASLEIPSLHSSSQWCLFCCWTVQQAFAVRDTRLNWTNAPERKCSRSSKGTERIKGTVWNWISFSGYNQWQQAVLQRHYTDSCQWKVTNWKAKSQLHWEFDRKYRNKDSSSWGAWSIQCYWTKVIWFNDRWRKNQSFEKFSREIS